jgi:hypothetical protein
MTLFRAYVAIRGQDRRKLGGKNKESHGRHV